MSVDVLWYSCGCEIKFVLSRGVARFHFLLPRNQVLANWVLRRPTM